MRLGIRQRFVLFLFSFFIVLFAGVAALLVVRTATSERTALNEQSRSFASLVTKPISDAFLLYKDSGKVRIEQQVDKYLALDPDVTGAAVVDTSGKILYYSGVRPSVDSKKASTFTTVYEVKNKVTRQIIDPVIEDYGIHRYAIVYSISDQRIVEETQRTVAIIVLLTSVGFALALVLVYWLINSIFLSPVRKISLRSLQISSGHLEEQIDFARNDEIGDLAKSVNTMANSLKADITKLQEADKLKSEFITISSHNLRTPLTVIKGDLEVMQTVGTVPKELEPMIKGIASSTARLNNFVDDLIAISSLESGKLAASEMKPASIKELLQTLATEYGPVAAEKKLQLNVAINLNAEQVAMNQHLLKMAFVNLLENAFKFTSQGSVGLSAAVESGQVVVKVNDTGTGIAAAEMPKLFTKFHRGTSVMRYDYEGTGIGLYLTKLIVEEHRGTISAVSTEGQGATFTITLPLAA
jgi:signal transduction histidine kinase